MAIQLLISDLDGTLLGPESVITPGTAAALEQARQAGLRLLVTTGRAWGTAAPLLQQAGVSCDFVLLNGAEYRTAQGELVRAVPLQPATARHGVAVLRRYDLGFEINTDAGDFTTDTELCPAAQPLPRLAAFWAGQPHQALVFGDGCNDLSLFRAFVHTRAMGNAATPLQALAEQVIEPNTEDGVAREIERLLMKQ